MKKIFSLFVFLTIVTLSWAQTTYNPSLHAVINKSVGIAQAGPTDARSMFFDNANFVYRAYTSTAEVLSYLNISKYRTGNFDIIINTGGVLSNGVITGGTNAVWWFKDGVLPEHLIRKTGDVLSVNGQTGVVVTKNADSLRNIRFDNSVLRNNYVFTYDSVQNKFILMPSVGTVYAPGAGIDITNGIIAAQTTSAIWNANQLRGRTITTVPPPLNTILKWNGTEYANAVDLSGIDTAYYDGDSLHLITAGEKISIKLNLGGSSGVVYIGYGLTGTNTNVDPIRADSSLIALKTDLPFYRDSLARVPGIDSIRIFRGGVHVYSIKDSTITPGAGDNWGTQVVQRNATLAGQGTAASPLGADTINYIASQYDLTVIANPNGSETIIINGTGYTVSGIGTTASPYQLNITGTPTSNPFKALSLETITGATANVIIPATGSNVTGTDNTPFLNTLIASAADGQWIVIPNGNWGFFTPVDTLKGSKTVNILILGNTYHNGSDFIIMANAGGPTENHTVTHMGECIGRINSATHSSSAYAAGTGPQWATYQGTPFKMYNSNQHYVQFNRIKGFKNGVEVIGWDYDGAVRGAEENYIEGRIIEDCANGVVLTSINGRSYVDKTYIYGLGGGALTLRTGLAIKIDGFSGVAFNGEIFNGAFRSNEFHLLIERTDSIAEIHGDVTEQLFDVTIEGSAVHSVTRGWNVRSVSPNFVRDPRYTGQGYWDVDILNGGVMGINAEGTVPIWHSPSGRRFGRSWRTDGAGKFIVVGSSLTHAQRTTSPSPTWMNYDPGTFPEKYVTITAATYTAAAGEVIQYNNAAGTLTLPAASSNPGRRITVMNIHASASLAVTNAATYTSVPFGDNMTWVSNGVDWRGIVNAEGAAGGSGVFTTDANGATTGVRIGIQTPSEVSSAMRLPASTTTLAPLRIPAGVHPTSPADGHEWRVLARRFTAYGSVVYEYMMVPDNGIAGDIVRRNAANTAYEHLQPNYERKFSLGTSLTVTGTGTAAIFNLPTGNDDREDVPIGSSFKCTIHGSISITNDATDPTIVFAIGNFLQTIVLDIPSGITSRNFEIEMTITRKSAGTHWNLKYTLDNGTLNILRMYEGDAAAYTTTGVDFTADWNWTQTGNSVTFKDAYWEIFRQQ